MAQGTPYTLIVVYRDESVDLTMHKVIKKKIRDGNQCEDYGTDGMIKCIEEAIVKSRKEDENFCRIPVMIAQHLIEPTMPECDDKDRAQDVHV